MAIVFNCPHCKTDYRLKDEFAGKTATCKNPNCRKVIPIPKPNTPVLASKKVNVDELAAQLFAEEGAPGQKVAEEQIQVTCIGCDHVWFVDLVGVRRHRRLVNSASKCGHARPPRQPVR